MLRRQVSLPELRRPQGKELSLPNPRRGTLSASAAALPRLPPTVPRGCTDGGGPALAPLLLPTVSESTPLLPQLAAATQAYAPRSRKYCAAAAATADGPERGCRRSTDRHLQHLSTEDVLRDMRRPAVECSGVKRKGPWNASVDRMRSACVRRQGGIDDRPVPSWNFRFGGNSSGNTLPSRPQMRSVLSRPGDAGSTTGSSRSTSRGTAAGPCNTGDNLTAADRPKRSRSRVQTTRCRQGTPSRRIAQEAPVAKVTQVDAATLKSRAARALQGAAERGMLRSVFCSLAEADNRELVANSAALNCIMTEEKSDQDEADRASARTVGTAVSSDMLGGSTVARAFALVDQMVADTRHEGAGDVHGPNSCLLAAQIEEQSKEEEEEEFEDDFEDDDGEEDYSENDFSDDCEGSESDSGSCTDLDGSSEA